MSISRNEIPVLRGPKTLESAAYVELETSVLVVAPSWKLVNAVTMIET